MIKITETIKNFAASAGDEGNFYTGLVDYLSHAMAEEGFDTKYDDKQTLDEKDALMKDLFIEQITADSGYTFNSRVHPRQHSNNRQVTDAAFAIIGVGLDLVLPTYLDRSVGVYSELRFGQWGDSFNFTKDSNALYAVYKVGNSRKHVEVQKDFSTNKTLLTEAYAITVQTAWYKMLTGEESIASFILKAAASIEKEMLVQVYTAFNSFAASLANSGVKQLRYNGYTTSNYLTLAQKVSAFNGAKAICMGTKAALGNVLPENVNYRIQIESPYVSVGYIRGYKGYDLFEMEQVASRTEFELELDDDKLYFLSPSGDKIVKIGVEGGTLTFSDTEQSDLTTKTTISKRWGLMAYTGSIMGLIELA